MRGVVVTKPGGPEVLQLKELPDLHPEEGQVLVEVKATTLNGADLLQRAGKYPPPPGASELLGLDAAGVVAEVGEGVSGLKVGQRVMALLDGGGYATQALAPEGYVMPIPGDLSFEDAAAIPEVFITAYLELFELGNLSKDERLLIHAGASGVGTAAIQLAKDAGAEVYATSSRPEKLQLCKDLGADFLINYKEEDFLEKIQERLKNEKVEDSAQGGRSKVTAVPGGGLEVHGVDVILDLVGAANFSNNLRALRVEGRLLLVGFASGTQAEIDLQQVAVKRLRIIGSTLRARPTAQKAEIVQSFAKHALPKFADGSLKPVVDWVFPLEQARQAHEYMEGKHNRGKVVLSMA